MYDIIFKGIIKSFINTDYISLNKSVLSLTYNCRDVYFTDSLINKSTNRHFPFFIYSFTPCSATFVNNFQHIWRRLITLLQIYLTHSKNKVCGPFQAVCAHLHLFHNRIMCLIRKKQVYNRGRYLTIYMDLKGYDNGR